MISALIDFMGLLGFAFGTAALIRSSIDRRRDARAPWLRIPEARCSCGHGAGMHAYRRTGTEAGCGAAVRRKLRGRVAAAFDGTDAFTWGECRCRTYDGPDPEQLRLLRGA